MAKLLIDITTIFYCICLNNTTIKIYVYSTELLSVYHCVNDKVLMLAVDWVEAGRKDSDK